MEQKNSKRTRWVTVRFTHEEHQKLLKLCQRTTCRKLSGYIRSCLFERPVVSTYRNASLDGLIEEIGQLKDELNHIGTNYNQTVKRLHGLWRIEDFKAWVELNERDKTILFQKLDEIEEHFRKLIGLWLR
ncbi:MAG: plasmid mobilization relaxosome protein MobC [Sediminicola sp.]